MVQKKHKKRKHNKPSGAQEAVASTAANEEDKKKAVAKASSKDSKSEKGKAKASAKNSKNKKPSIWRRFVDYCKAVRVEMQRVVWPTRSELINASLIVIGAIIFFGVLIAIVDNIVIIPLDWISTLGV